MDSLESEKKTIGKRKREEGEEEGAIVAKNTLTTGFVQVVSASDQWVSPVVQVVKIDRLSGESELERYR